MEQNRQIEIYRRQFLQDNTDAFMRGEVDEVSFEAAIDASGVPEFEKPWIRNIAEGKRRATPKHLTLAEVETLIKAHIMSLDDLRMWMTRENYPDDEQTLLELWLFGKITSADQAAQAKIDKANAAQKAAAAKQAAAQQKAAAAAAKAEVKGVSIGDFQKLIESGARTFEDYRAFLAALGLQTPAITDLVELLHQTITAKQTLQQQHDALTAEADLKHIPISQTEKAVLAGVLTIDDLKAFMTKYEYSPTDIAIAIGYTQSQLDAAKAKASTKKAATGKAAAKNISLPDLERAARLGLTTPADYAAALDAAGFTAESRDLLVGILTDQIRADAAAELKRKEATAKAAAKSISLPNLEKAIIAGLRPIADYRAQLSALGYDAADQQSMIDLLQLAIDHAKTVKPSP